MGPPNLPCCGDAQGYQRGEAETTFSCWPAIWMRAQTVEQLSTAQRNYLRIGKAQRRKIL